MKKFFSLSISLIVCLVLITGAYAGNKLSVTGLTVDAQGELSYELLNETVTTSDTVTAAETGKTFFMRCTSQCVMTLPVADEGLHYSFVNGNTVQFDINPNGTDTLYYLTLAAGDAMRSGATVGDAVTVAASDDTAWFVRTNEAFTDVN